MHVLDVGQGDAILLICDGESLLIDAGPIEAGKAVHDYIGREISDRHLNCVIATHAHDDHLGGMQEALRGMSVEMIYAPPAIPATYWMEKIFPQTSVGTVSVVLPDPDLSFQVGGANIRFLNRLTAAETENDLSLVIRIEYGKQAALMMADMESAGEISLLEAEENLRADVLKVGHHGGNTSTGDAFLKAVQPKYAVISVGTGNKHGHPHQEVLNRLVKTNAAIYRTDQLGTIVLTTDGETWTVQGTRAGT